MKQTDQLYWSTVLAFTFAMTASFSAQLLWSYLWVEAQHQQLMKHIIDTNAASTAHINQLTTRLLQDVRQACSPRV